MSDNVKEKLTIKEWLPLIGMTFAAFLFNTSEFMPIGLLSTIAEDFAMTEAEIGRNTSVIRQSQLKQLELINSN